jgi:hypothetical protein
LNPPTDPALPFLGGYPEHLLVPVRRALAEGTLGEHLARRYPQAHTIRSDTLLYERAAALKQRHLRHAGPLARVAFDNRLQLDHRALGTLTSVSRVQGGRLKAKREIRISAVFKEAPAEMLEMILVHELAHLKEREHDKAFYALCEHMLPGYHQIEFDTRLYLTWQASRPASLAAPAASADA